MTEGEAVEIVRDEVAKWMVRKSSLHGILITLGRGDAMRSTPVLTKEGDDETMVRLRAINAMRTLQDEFADDLRRRSPDHTATEARKPRTWVSFLR